MLEQANATTGLNTTSAYELNTLATTLEIYGQFAQAHAMRYWYAAFMALIEREYGEINASNAQA